MGPMVLSKENANTVFSRARARVMTSFHYGLADVGFPFGFISAAISTLEIGAFETA